MRDFIGPHNKGSVKVERGKDDLASQWVRRVP